MAGGISPISSSSRVPPWAASILPTMRRVAVLCAPFSAPNSSLSNRVSGTAAQLTSTNGPRAGRTVVQRGPGSICRCRSRR